MDINYLQIASNIHNNVKSIILNDFYKNNLIQIKINNESQFLDLTMFELRNYINTLINSEFNKLDANISKSLAFPIGINGDKMVAHYTPIQLSKQYANNLPYYANPFTQLKHFKIIKIDYGISIEGNIIDKAFSLNINKTELEDLLITTSNLAVNTVIKNIGVGVRLIDLARDVKEFVESYEYNEEPIKIVDNIYSHNIKSWRVHGNKFIKPDWTALDYNGVKDLKVESDEQWAIEIYCSNGIGKGKLIEDTKLFSHYKICENYINNDNSLKKIPIFENDELNKLIGNITNPLPFCPNSISFKYNKKKVSCTKIVDLCQHLHSNKVLESYPPVIEASPSNCSVSQIEKNIIVGSSIIEL